MSPLYPFSGVELFLIVTWRGETLKIHSMGGPFLMVILIRASPQSCGKRESKAVCRFIDCSSLVGQFHR
jgi:hypothetical protein